MRSDLTEADIKGIMEEGRASAALAGSQVTDPYLQKLIEYSISGKITRAEADKAALEYILHGRKRDITPDIP